MPFVLGIAEERIPLLFKKLWKNEKRMKNHRRMQYPLH